MDQLFLYCWIAYTVTYLGRYNLSAAMADMVLQGVLTKSQGGLIATCFFVSYGAGQLLSGILGDKLNGRWMVGSGLLLSGAMNLAMGLTGDWRIMAAIWMVNGVTQSMIWSPLLRILAEAMPRKRCLKAGIDLATTIPAGTLASYGMTAAAIALSRRILREGESAVRDYIGFLSGGCSADPVTLLRSAGVDMASPAPVEDATRLFDELIGEMEALLA